MFGQQKISTKKWPKNDPKLPKLAQKLPKIAKMAQKWPKMAQKLATAEKNSTDISVASAAFCISVVAAASMSVGHFKKPETEYRHILFRF